MLAVRTEDLVRKFGDFTAVDRLDLAVEQGEIYGLLGPNGAGKTTTIRMLAGLLPPTSGSAEVLGMRVPDRAIAPGIGYMPQEISLYQGLTVHQNMVFFGRLFGMDGASISAREEKLLRFIDLAEWRDTLVQKLSGGMKHRVSLACALIHQPRVLFLDEPTVGVDPMLRASFWEYFSELREGGTTVIITTHYMDEARHCDRVGLMRSGKLIAEGRPDELMQRTGTDNLEDAFLSFAAGEVGP